MDCELFGSLSVGEARSLLEGFLETESAAVEATLAEARQQGLRTDYSIESVAPLLRWAVGQVKTVPIPEDTSVPTWIRETESYKSSLVGFDNASKPIVLRLAYYLGECFVRGFAVLTWAVGGQETALKNMPVVSGFGNGIELAPMLVAENLLLRVLSGNGRTPDDFDVAVRTWTAYVAGRG
jgi:hypothetical protein